MITSLSIFVLMASIFFQLPKQICFAKIVCNTLQKYSFEMVEPTTNLSHLKELLIKIFSKLSLFFVHFNTRVPEPYDKLPEFLTGVHFLMKT